MSNEFAKSKYADRGPFLVVYSRYISSFGDEFYVNSQSQDGWMGREGGRPDETSRLVKTHLTQHFSPARGNGKYRVSQPQLLHTTYTLYAPASVFTLSSSYIPQRGEFTTFKLSLNTAIYLSDKVLESLLDVSD